MRGTIISVGFVSGDKGVDLTARDFMYRYIYIICLLLYIFFNWFFFKLHLTYPLKYEFYQEEKLITFWPEFRCFVRGNGEIVTKMASDIRLSCFFFLLIRKLKLLIFYLILRLCCLKFSNIIFWYIKSISWELKFIIYVKLNLCEVRYKIKPLQKFSQMRLFI